MTTLNDELDLWDRTAHDLVEAREVPDIWPVLERRHPGLLAAWLRVEGRPKGVLVLRSDIDDSTGAAWLAETRTRLAGARPLNLIAGGDELPGIWYVFGAAAPAASS